MFLIEITIMKQHFNSEKTYGHSDIATDTADRIKTLGVMLEMIDPCEATANKDKDTYRLIFRTIINLAVNGSDDNEHFENVIDTLNISQATLKRWSEGITAPHPLAGPFMLKPLKDAAEEELQLLTNAAFTPHFGNDIA